MDNILELTFHRLASFSDFTVANSTLQCGINISISEIEQSGRLIFSDMVTYTSYKREKLDLIMAVHHPLIII